MGFAWLAVGIVLALAKLPPIPLDISYTDKIEHAVAFSLMMLYAGMLFPRDRGWAALGLLIYGIKIEMLQLLVPWRSAEWMDIGADACGIGLGWLLLLTPAQRLLSSVDGWLATISLLNRSRR